jgi:hypothetical protein
MSATPSRPLLSPPRPNRTRQGRRAALAAALLLVAGVSGCGPKDDQFPPVCPSLSLLGDGGDLTRFANGGHDVTDMVLQARIVGVPAKCQATSPTQVTATLTVQTEVTRGPAAHDARLQATYFIALTEGPKVLKEQDFPLVLNFPPNVDHMNVGSDEIELLLPVGKNKTAAAYHIYVGFRLTPEQLAYNRTHRAP